MFTSFKRKKICELDRDLKRCLSVNLLLVLTEFLRFCLEKNQWGSIYLERWRRKMGKIVNMVGVLGVSLLILVGCGGSTESAETSHFSGSVEGASEGQISVTHEGQTIQEIEIVESFDLATLGLDTADLSDEDKALVEESFASGAEEYDGSEGVTIVNEFSDNTFTLTMTVDMTNADSEVLSSLSALGISTSEDAEELKYDDLVNYLKNAGYKEE